ncbi:MAG: hypothetical protein LKJ31_07310 [Atopobiaceae bacterium]|jgi:hypothetical protein|nr:hypothetical protein [Atopobiaceae bacterium]
MKSELDARPVYLHEQDMTTGHFLVCYLAVLLIRILQVKILKGVYSTEDIMGLVKHFRIIGISERRYVNISRSSSLIDDLEKRTGAPLINYYLTKSQVDSIVNARF